jgi:hypothetical protein
LAMNWRILAMNWRILTMNWRIIGDLLTGTLCDSPTRQRLGVWTNNKWIKYTMGSSACHIIPILLFIGKLTVTDDWSNVLVFNQMTLSRWLYLTIIVFQYWTSFLFVSHCQVEALTPIGTIRYNLNDSLKSITYHWPNIKLVPESLIDPQTQLCAKTYNT